MTSALRESVFVALVCLLGANLIASELVPKTGGALRVPLSSDLSSLDPALCYNFPASFFVRVIYQGLLDYGDGAELVPCLAKSWSISTDGLAYTFELDPRAHFSSGRKVVAADYVFSLERMLSPKMHCPGDFLYLGIKGVKEFREGRAAHIAGLTVPAPDRLVITLTQPDMTFLYRLAMPFASPVCAEELKDLHHDIGMRSAGAGPFKLERWVRGATLKMVRNPHYGGGLPAYLDEVHATIGVDQVVGEMMFERGELDIADLNDGVAAPEFTRILNTPSLRENLNAQPSSIISYFSLNTEMKPLDDKRVRQAMNYAVNKDRLVAIQAGRVEKIPGVLPPVMPGYQPDLQGYDYSPEKARELLRDAGFPDGFTTTIVFNNGVQENFRVVAAIQEDLRRVGIIVEATPLSFPAYLDKSQTRKAVPVALAAWAQDYPDPSNYLEPMLSGAAIKDRECQNMAFYNNPEVDALLAKAAKSLDMKERLVLYQKAERIVVDDAPWLFLTALKQYCLHQPWVHKTEPHLVWAFRFEKMWMEPRP